MVLEHGSLLRIVVGLMAQGPGQAGVGQEPDDQTSLLIMDRGGWVDGSSWLVRWLWETIAGTAAALSAAGWPHPKE